MNNLTKSLLNLKHKYKNNNINVICSEHINDQNEHFIFIAVCDGGEYKKGKDIEKTYMVKITADELTDVGPLPEKGEPGSLDV